VKDKLYVIYALPLREMLADIKETVSMTRDLFYPRRKL